MIRSILLACLVVVCVQGQVLSGSWRTAIAGNWNDTNAWTSGALPPTQTAFITITGTYTVTVLRRPETLTGKLTIGSTTANPTLLIAPSGPGTLGGALSVQNIEVLGGSISIQAGGQLTVSQNITINLGSASTALLTSAGTLSYSGYITVTRGILQLGETTGLLRLYIDTSGVVSLIGTAHRTQSGCTITGPGKLSLDAGIIIHDFTCNIATSVVVNGGRISRGSGSTFTVAGPINFVTGELIVSDLTFIVNSVTATAGTLTLAGTNMRQTTGSTFNVQTGTMIIGTTTTGSAVIEHLIIGAPLNAPTFDSTIMTNISRVTFNGGTITASGTAGRIFIRNQLQVAPQATEIATFAGPVTLEGTGTHVSGTLALTVPPASVGIQCGLLGTGTMTVSPDAIISVDRNCTWNPTLRLNGGVFTSSAATPATLNVVGSSTLDSGTNDVHATLANIQFSGPTSWLSGAISLGESGSVDIRGTMNVNSINATVQNALPEILTTTFRVSTTGVVNVASGTVMGVWTPLAHTGTINVDTSAHFFTRSGGSCTNPGKFSVSADGLIDIATFALVAPSCIPTGEGTIEFGGGATFNLPAGTWGTNVRSRDSAILRPAGNMIIMRDLTTKNSSRFETTNGNLEVRGNLFARDTSFVEALPQHPITIGGNLVLSGNCDVNARSDITVTGNVNVTETGELRVRGGRVTAASATITDRAKYTCAMDSMQPDVFTVTGTAYLDGRLELDLDPLFAPTTNTPIVVMEFGNNVGQFDEVVEPARSLYVFTPEYTPTSVRVTATENSQVNGATVATVCIPMLTTLFFVMMALF